MGTGDLAEAPRAGEAPEIGAEPRTPSSPTTHGETSVETGIEHRRARALFAMLVGICVMFANIYATQPILPALSSDFDVSPAESALTVSLVVFGMGIASLLYGPLSDQAGRRPVIVVTACLLILPTIGVALAPTFSLLLASRALQGLLIPGITAVGLAYLQEVLPVSWRGVSTSAYASATALGGLMGRLQAGFLTDSYGWRIASSSFILTTTLSAALLLFALPVTPRHVRVSGGDRLRRARELARGYLHLGQFFRQRRVLGGALIGFTMFFGFVSIYTYLPYRMEQPPFSLSQSQVSLLYLVYLVGFVVTPLTGRLSDLLGRNFVIGAALVLMISGAIYTSLDDLPGVILGLALLNIGLLAAHAAASAFVNDHAASSGHGSATSFYLVFYYFGGTVGPIVCGVAWQTFGWPGVLAGCLTTVALALGALFTLCA